MKKAIFLLFGLMLVSVHGFAQEKELDEADNAFEAEKYTDAIDLYKKAYVAYGDTKKTKGMKGKEVKATKAHIIFQIGECYRNLNDVKQEAQWYQKVMKIQGGSADSAAAAGYYFAAQKWLDSVQMANPEPKPVIYNRYQPLDTAKH
jgi:hypothetical protein